MESELFGHERGSFTDDDRRHKGPFERASAGHSFWMKSPRYLVELPVKQLRVLETNTFVRVGGGEPISGDVLLAATNRSLAHGSLASRQGPQRTSWTFSDAGLKKVPLRRVGATQHS